MTDHATRARELYHKILAEDPSQSVESIADALTRAAEEAGQVIKRQVGLDCGNHGCYFAINKFGMRTNGPCSCDPKKLKSGYDELYARFEALTKSQAAQTVWSKERPKVAGFWLFRRGKKGAVDSCTIRQTDIDFWDQMPHRHDTEWAGPLLMPREA